jgi:hypothetical protein
MAEKRSAYRVFIENPEGRNHYEDLNVDERILVKFVFKNWS